MAEKTIVNPFIFPSELKFYFILLLFSASAPVFSFSLSILEMPPFLYHFTLFPIFTFLLLPFLVFQYYNRSIKYKVRKYSENKLSEKYPDIFNLISKSSRQMKVKVPECLYVDSDELNALAFGSEKKPYLLVSTGLCKKFRVFPNLVETVLVHELSHIKNRDLKQHEIAESLWKSFILIAVIGSLGSLLSTRFEDIRIWLVLVILFYLVPALTVFYLNNMIQRWREIYADARTIAFQRTYKNLVAVLRLFYPLSGLGLKKLFSPFILTPIKRIKILKEDIFKHVIERGTICTFISVISLFSTIFSTVFLWNLIGGINLYLSIVFIWTLSTFFLVSIVLLPYWTYSLKKIKSIYQYAINAFFTPLKVSIILTIPQLLLPILTQWALLPEWFIYFFLMCFFFLFAHQLAYHIILSLIPLKIKTKIILSESILFIFPVALLNYILNLADIVYAVVIAVIFVSILLILAARYAKCPYCGKDIRLFGLFKCPYCSHKLNEEFLISLQ